MQQSGLFGIAEHQIEILHRLAAGALDQVVDGGRDDQRATVDRGAEIGKIGARNIADLNLLRARANSDEGPTFIGGTPRVDDLGQSYSGAQRRGQSGVDASGQRGQVGDKT